MLGSTNDPEPDQAAAVAGTVFSAVIVYAVRTCLYSIRNLRIYNLYTKN